MYVKILSVEIKLTFHVHVWCFVYKMHKKLCSADEDLVSTVSDWAVPPCALKQVGKNEAKLISRTS